MDIRRKRPLGITLLALPFLWIGIGGTIVFPIILLAHGLNHIGDSLPVGQMHSELLRSILLGLVLIVWYAGYVFYAYLGWGLWKLRNGARRAMVIVQWIGLGMASVVGVIMVIASAKLAALASLMAISIILPIAAILWYLHQPHVLAAFGTTPPTDVATTGVPPPPVPERTSPWKIAIVSVLGLAVFGGSLLLFVERVFKSSTVFAMTLKAAQESPCVIQRLGIPVQAKGLISGRINVSNLEGSAYLEIPVVGQKGKASLAVSATKSEGNWQITTLNLIQNDDSMKLIPVNESTSCY